MRDFLMGDDSEFWDILLDGPFIPTMGVRKDKPQELFF